MANETRNRGIASTCACAIGELAKENSIMTKNDKRFNTVKVDWKEVYYTNCPLVSASNVDQELGWTKEEYKKIGVNYLVAMSSWTTLQQPSGSLCRLPCHAAPRILSDAVSVRGQNPRLPRVAIYRGSEPDASAARDAPTFGPSGQQATTPLGDTPAWTRDLASPAIDGEKIGPARVR
jgi:hypothetical protein